jgi:hypothetical protein
MTKNGVSFYMFNLEIGETTYKKKEILIKTSIAEDKFL